MTGLGVIAEAVDAIEECLDGLHAADHIQKLLTISPVHCGRSSQANPSRREQAADRRGFVVCLSHVVERGVLVRTGLEHDRYDATVLSPTLPRPERGHDQHRHAGLVSVMTTRMLTRVLDAVDLNKRTWITERRQTRVCRHR